MTQPRPTAEQLRALLERRFGHPSFREGQLDAIEAVLGGRDVVAVMPTGGGKSLLYQLPALVLPGVTLVVSPLIALMKDQVDALVERELEASFVNSTLSPSEQDERLDAAARGRLKLLYLAPERFRNPRFRCAVEGLRVSLLAIDEAHCISEWGHDFRPDYRRLKEARELLGSPPVIALTATATPEVREDIVRELALDAPLTLVTGFDRKNLFLSVFHARNETAKLLALERTIDEVSGAGIVYVASRKSAERVVSRLAARRLPVGLYHAGLGDEERSREQERFMAGQARIMVATNAFGMGIDKADIRFVVHYEFPKSLEAYYQEIGRAGRDGLPAQARLLFCYVDKRIGEFFVENANPSYERVAEVYGEVLRQGDGATAAQVASALGERSDHGVSSALAVLERARVIAREATPGSRARSLRVLERVDPGALPLDRELLRRKLEADQRKLQAVVQYAYHAGCRKERLLAYFGDTRRKRTCEACDACERRRGSSRPLDAAEAAIGRACLEAVDAVRFGRVKVARLLVGETGGREPAPEEAPGWPGQLRHLGERAVLGWLDALLDGGYLEKVELGTDRGYILRVAAPGQQVLRGEGTLEMAPPDGGERRRTEAVRLDGTTAQEELPRETAPRRRREAPRPPAPSLPEPAGSSTPGPASPEILAALKGWRRREAQRRAVPAYVIFHDAVLERIAARRPASEEELSGISGIGPRKLEEYGRAVLEVVRKGA